ncbi:MAG: hypothetical protein EAX89_15460 [Candidatus Lokiarchaeota archaeon]|nr:hypothetical protein [Candidatus Lokiarchaeota archaeon]
MEEIKNEIDKYYEEIELKSKKELIEFKKRIEQFKGELLGLIMEEFIKKSKNKTSIHKLPNTCYYCNKHLSFDEWNHAILEHGPLGTGVSIICPNCYKERGGMI